MKTQLDARQLWVYNMRRFKKDRCKVQLPMIISGRQLCLQGQGEGKTSFLSFPPKVAICFFEKNILYYISFMYPYILGPRSSRILRILECKFLQIPAIIFKLNRWDLLYERLSPLPSLPL